jgi:hypothetical protein
MAPPPAPFELCIEGTDQLRQYVRYVPDGHGGRAAEHMFEWRHDTVYHVEFGQELINQLSEEEPHDRSSA